MCVCVCVYNVLVWEGSFTDWRYALWACHIAYVSIHIAAVFIFQTWMNKATSSYAPLNSFNLVIETLLATLQINGPSEPPFSKKQKTDAFMMTVKDAQMP